jgi:uncharacterized protein GlcG (DUF336 family)
VSWATEQTQAIVAALQGAFEDGVMVAVAAVDQDGQVTAHGHFTGLPGRCTL